MLRLFFNLVLTVFCLVAFATFAGKGPTDPIPAKSNYVVIGAFSYIKNAERFAKYASTTKEMKAEFAMNPARNLYYVYMFHSDDLDTAIATVLKVREEHPDLWDAWVYKGSFSEEEESNPETIIANPVALTPATTGAEAFQSDEPEVISEVEDQPMQEVAAEVASTIEPEPMVEAEVVPPSNIEAKEGFYYLYFNTINKKTMKEVRGRVRVIDPERSKEISTEESHQVVELKDPNNGTKRIKAATQIFGFKEVQHMINLDAPLTDSTSAFVDVVGDSIILDFELERFKKGDVLVMYNVYFFKDAAVMKPESKYELLSLLDMLEENDKLKVRIHGHTNGNASGKIIHMDEEKNFFSLVAEQEEDYGSAKKLSQFRAETIQDWLVEQGVNPERMSVRGWGGKQMIYGKHDTQAHKNVRVEIEIIEE
jgi:outer membrane protein OmpA-like peptidoglycan-associated protein